MGAVGKGIAVFFGVAVAASIAATMSTGHGGSGARSTEDRCADRINSRLPSGAFVVTHTSTDSAGRTEWLIDHNGMREPIACEVSKDGNVVLTALRRD